jgi:hypothetical protein
MQQCRASPSAPALLGPIDSRTTPSSSHPPNPNRQEAAGQARRAGGASFPRPAPAPKPASSTPVMKIVAIALHRYQRDTPEPIILTQASELESFGYFQRNGCVPAVCACLPVCLPAYLRACMDEMGRVACACAPADGCAAGAAEGVAGTAGTDQSDDRRRFGDRRIRTNQLLNQSHTPHLRVSHPHQKHTPIHSIREMCRFMSKTLIKRCQPGQRQTIQHEGASRSRAVASPCRAPLTPIHPYTNSHTHPTTHTEYNVHCYLRTDGLGGTVIADLEYPPRVAFVLLSTLIERFAVEVS